MHFSRRSGWVGLVLSILVLVAACGSSEPEESIASSTTDEANASTTVTPSTEASTTAAPTATTATAGPAVVTTPEPTGCSDLTQGSYVVLTTEGYEMKVFVPTGFVGAELPVVINWHGLGSNGPQQAGFTNYEVLAEREGFIVVHPTGKPVPGDNLNSWELAQFDSPDRDHIALAHEIIDKLTTDFCADPDRVYSTGMSNGAFFTSHLVCELADRIAAAVSVAGVTHDDGCSPSRPVPMMAYHGTADEVVPFNGGTSTLGDDEFFQQVMPEEFSQFAADFNCDAEPAASNITDEVIRYDYTGCDDDVPLVFFEIANGGHTWPNSPLGPFLAAELGVTTTDVDATADGWAFMSQFSL